MKTTIEYTSGTQFRVEARSHAFICDQPPENQGMDTGMTPPELMLASLGTCAGFYALQYLRTRNLPTQGLRVEVNAEKAKQPARIGRFEIRVEVPNITEERHKEGLKRAVEACLIHNTLTHPPEIALTIETPVTV